MPTRIFDVTVPLGASTPLFPGDPPIVFRRMHSLAAGDPLTLSEVCLGSHAGTHVDAPSHFIDGAKCLGDYPVDAFLGPASVLACEKVKVVDLELIAGTSIPKRHHVLIKTANSEFVDEQQFHPEYVSIEPEVAHFLVEECECLSVGVDYYSLDPYDSTTYPAHKILARAGILAFVCLNLRSVEPGLYDFYALPPRFENLEAAPVRAVLIA